MKSTAADQIREFLECFFPCDDGIVRGVNIDLGCVERGASATIEISVRDRNSKNSDLGWVNLVLNVNKLREFRLTKNFNEDCKILSNGVHVGKFEGHVFIDFGTLTHETSPVEDFRSSYFGFAGDSVTWEVRPYRL